MVRRTGFWFVALCASLMLVSAVSAVDVDLPKSELVARDLLAHGGLKPDWQINLPLQKDENLGALYIDGDYLYAFTDKNFLFCINRKKGTQRFGIRITNPNLPVHKPFFYDGTVILTVGTKVLQLDPYVGKVIYSKDMGLVGRSTACSAVRNSENFYIAGSNKCLHAIDAAEYFLRFKVSADNDSLINSILVNDEDVVFASKSGNVTSVSANNRKSNWQTDIATGIAAGLATQGEEVYVSSLDTKLYCLDKRDGKERWDTPFQAGGGLTTSVRIGKDVVYQYAEDEGLYAVSRKTGKQVWNLKKGFDLLTELNNRAYVIGKPSVLYVMDNKKAKELYSVNIAGVASYAVNTTDSKIYMAGKKGRVMSVDIANPRLIID
jgi:outer membrane protein assembly factor BamB